VSGWSSAGAGRCASPRQVRYEVLALYRERELQPPAVHEVREMQPALGLVAAETGICLVPTPVERFRRDNVESRPLDEEKAIMKFWRILGPFNSQNRAFTP